MEEKEDSNKYRLCDYLFIVIGFNMDDYHSMTLKETQWFSEGNFLEIGKEGCGRKRRLQ